MTVKGYDVALGPRGWGGPAAIWRSKVQSCLFHYKLAVSSTLSQGARLTQEKNRKRKKGGLTNACVISVHANTL